MNTPEVDVQEFLRVRGIKECSQITLDGCSWRLAWPPKKVACRLQDTVVIWFYKEQVVSECEALAKLGAK